MSTSFKRVSVFLLTSLFLFVAVAPGYSQLKEPEVIDDIQPRTPLSEGYYNAWTVDILLNNFGFGLAGQYSRVIGPYTQLTFKTGITGIRDASEQSFQDFFSGQKLIPNKYKRAIGFPFLVGIKKRLFAEQVNDNFRFYVAGSGGPVMSFVFPYLRDIDGNGYRSIELINGRLVNTEPINDFFSGWGDGETKWGVTGEFKIGVDFGDNFGRLTSVEFGYFFYYFGQGIQMMEPRRPQTNEVGQIIVNPDGSFPSEPFFDEQKLFGTPQITFSFGGMW